MVDVFISYAKGDRALVQVLAREIAGEGYVVWWDDDIPPHLSYGEVITETIGGARAAIVVWSRAATASEWVRAEADMAREQKKLIQTSIDGGTPPLPFNQIQWAQLDGWAGEADHPGWRKVKTSLLALCGPPGDSEPGAGPPPRPAPIFATRSADAPKPPAPPAPRPWALRTGTIIAGIGILLLLGLGSYFLLGPGGPREDAAAAAGLFETPGGASRAAGPGFDGPFQPDGSWRMSVAPPDGDRERTLRGRITIDGDTASFALARGGETQARGRCAVARQGPRAVRFTCTNSDTGTTQELNMVAEDSATMRGTSSDEGRPMRIRMSRRQNGGNPQR